MMRHERWFRVDPAARRGRVFSPPEYFSVGRTPKGSKVAIVKAESENLNDRMLEQS